MGGSSTHVGGQEFNLANRKQSTHCTEIMPRLESSYLARPSQQRAVAQFHDQT